LANYFEDSRVLSLCYPSADWVIPFLDLQTLLTRDRQQFAAFQTIFVKINPGNEPANWKKGLKFPTKTVQALLVFRRV
jgi:hypothetical protein